MQLTLEDLQDLEETVPAPKRNGEARRVRRVVVVEGYILFEHVAAAEETAYEDIVLTAKQFESYARGIHLRWVVNCDVAL